MGSNPLHIYREYFWCVTKVMNEFCYYSSLCSINRVRIDAKESHKRLENTNYINIRDQNYWEER